MSDILVTKSIETLKAFNNEFKHLIPNVNGAVFYVKQNDKVIPFKGFAFKKETGEMRVQIELNDGRRVYMNVNDQDEIYFTTNVIFLSDYSLNENNLNNLVPGYLSKNNQ